MHGGPGDESPDCSLTCQTSDAAPRIVGVSWTCSPEFGTGRYVDSRSKDETQQAFGWDF